MKVVIYLIAYCILGLGIFSSCHADTSSIGWPAVGSCLAPNGGTKFNVSGHLLYVPFAVELVGHGNISCSTVYNVLPNWIITCTAPAGTYATYVDLKLYMYDGFSGGTYIQTQVNTFIFNVGGVTSISPTGLAYGGGTLLTLMGSCFGNDVSTFRYISFGNGPTMYTSSWVSVSDTKIVVSTGAIGSGTRESLLDVYLAFDTSAYYRYNSMVQYIQPSIVSASDVSINGGIITVTGARFGTDKNFYRYASFAHGGSSFVVLPSDTTWISTADTSLVFKLPSCCENSISSSALALAYDTSAYVQVNVLNWVYPTLTGVGTPIGVDSPSGFGGYTHYVGATLYGNNFGLPGTSFYTYIGISGETTFSPNINVIDQNNIQFWWIITDDNYADPQPNHHHTNVNLYLHWGTSAYGWINSISV